MASRPRCAAHPAQPWSATTRSGSGRPSRSRAVEDRGHRGRGVGVPERRAALLDGDVRELEDHALVRHQPAGNPYDLAARRPQRLRGLAVHVEQAAGVAGGEEDPFGALDGLAQPGGGPVQGVDGQLGVDGVLPEPVLRIVADPAPLGHHGQHVLLVAPPVAQLEAQPVVPVPVGQAAVVGQVVVPRGGDVPRDARTDEVFDEGGAAGYRHGAIVPWRVPGVPAVPGVGQCPGTPCRSPAAAKAPRASRCSSEAVSVRPGWAPGRPRCGVELSRPKTAWTAARASCSGRSG